jgi:CRP-like cAMP-binding protein
MDPILHSPGIGALQRIPIFSDLGAAGLRRIVPLMAPFGRQPGEQLFCEGDAPDGMYVIDRGEVAVTTTGADGEPILLAELGNGSVIGEMSLAEGSARSATVAAISATSGQFISRERFEDLRAQGDPGAYMVLLALARTLEERRRSTEQRLRTLLDDPDRAARLRTKSMRHLVGVIAKA